MQSKSPFLVLRTGSDYIPRILAVTMHIKSTMVAVVPFIDEFTEGHLLFSLEHLVDVATSVHLGGWGIAVRFLR